MGALLHDLPLLHHDYLVGGANGAQVVRHHEHRPVLRERRDGPLHEHLVDRVHVARHLVEHEDGGVLQERPRDGQPLLLAAREAHAVLPDGRRIALRERHHELVDAGPLGRLHHFPMRRIRPADADVPLDGVSEQAHVLHDDADGGQEVVVGDVPHVHTADAYASRIHVPEPQQEVGQRALARSGLAHECRHGALGDRERRLGQLERVPSVGEAHPVEPDRVR